MDVVAISGEQWFATQEPSADGEKNVEDGKPKRYEWNGDRDDCRSFLRTGEGQGTDHEANEQTAGIAKENGRRMKIEAKEADDHSSKNDGKQSDQRVRSK